MMGGSERSTPLPSTIERSELLSRIKVGAAVVWRPVSSAFTNIAEE